MRPPRSKCSTLSEPLSSATSTRPSTVTAPPFSGVGVMWCARIARVYGPSGAFAIEAGVGQLVPSSNWMRPLALVTGAVLIGGSENTCALRRSVGWR